MPSRRYFLRHAAGFASVAIGHRLLGCGGDANDAKIPSSPSGQDASPDIAPFDTGAPVDAADATSSSDVADAAPADLESLAESLDGDVVAQGDATYDTARLLYNTRFDGLRPQAIVYCETAADVQKTVAYALRTKTPLAVRSGGHSYAGYSSCAGIILDVGRMNAISIDVAKSTVTVGPGIALIDLYAALAEHDLALPLGSCPTVAISGLALGGGIGPLGRKHGLTADNLLQLDVVIASGELVTCDDTSHADLFWASRGGGGGNFGVATRFTFEVHPVATATYFELAWPFAQAATILAAWQGFGPSAPDELFSICGLFSGGFLASKKDVAYVTVYGVFLGSEADFATLIAPLESTTAGAATDRTVVSDTFFRSIMRLAYCGERTAIACRDDARKERATYIARSDIAKTALTADGIEAAVRWVDARQKDPLLGDGGVMFDAHGGAIGRVAKADTAYVHRDALFSAQYLASWDPKEASATANGEWMSGFYAEMRAYFSGEAYQNYIDPDLADWQNAYYGTNFPRLASIKRIYDPDSFFTFAQGIKG